MNTDQIIRELRGLQQDHRDDQHAFDVLRHAIEALQHQAGPRHCGHCGQDWKNCVCTPQDLE